MYAVGAAAGDAMTGDKIEKSAAGYKPARETRVRCGTCSMFRPPVGCTLVKGDISAQAVCDFWEQGRGDDR